MLTGVQDEIIRILSFAFPYHRRHLYYLWPCSYYYCYFHGSFSLSTLFPLKIKVQPVVSKALGDQHIGSTYPPFQFMNTSCAGIILTFATIYLFSMTSESVDTACKSARFKICFYFPYHLFSFIQCRIFYVAFIYWFFNLHLYACQSGY